MGSVRYSVIIEWDDSEQVYVATVPALSVATYGDTREQALEKVREAILVTIDGLRDIGQPVPDGDAGKVEVLEVEV
jgi:predicted RNase H-like HicB family nuclease